MLISPTEPVSLRALGKVSSVPERFGSDFLIIAQGSRTGIQRKQFPADFISSLADGRLYQEVHQMAPLHRAVLVVEGLGRWTLDGQLLDDHIRNFTRKQFRSLLFSIAWEFGVQVFITRDMRETTEFLMELDAWARKKEHRSLRSRPGPRGNSWGVKTNKDWAIHVATSFPGIGVTLGQGIYDHFGGLPLQWTVSEDELRGVPGIGKDRARQLIRALGSSKDSGQG